MLLLATVTNGLLAGLFFAFSCGVSPAMTQVDDATFVESFRAINRAILNPWFLGVYFLAPVSAITTAILGGGVLAVAAAGLSMATFALTAVCNVPLNQRLDRAATSSTADRRAARSGFEAGWSRWNLLRTITAVAALALLTATE